MKKMILTKEYKHLIGDITYKLRISVYSSKIENGILFDRERLDQMIRAEVVDIIEKNQLKTYLKKRHTMENIALWIWDRMEKALSFKNDVELCEVECWDDENTFVTYSGGKVKEVEQKKVLDY